MPRLSPAFILKARQYHPYLPLLLYTCRTLPSALRELQWLREHAVKTKDYFRGSGSVLYHLCLRRSRGEPLQYILGNQPFGDLDILCKPGVLIPRFETEAYTISLAQLVRQNVCKSPTRTHTKDRSLRILDLCTGTGCIPLLLHTLLSPCISHLSILGVDISSEAISLAEMNREWNIKIGKLKPIAHEQMKFIVGDVLDKKFALLGNWDIMISNPPYISPRGFNTETSRSVRNYEPRLALVPAAHDSETTAFGGSRGDLFYPRLLELANEAGVQLLLMEIDGHHQASRVRNMVLDTKAWDGCNVWLDDLCSLRSNLEAESVSATGERSDIIPRVGKGRERAIICWKGEGGARLELGGAYS